MPAKQSTFELITSQITDALEGGVVPWKMPWQQRALRPINIRGSFYRGINHFLLSVYGRIKGYGSPYWLTYKQAQESGGNVKKGEKAIPVVFWKNLLVKNKEKEDEADPGLAAELTKEGLEELPKIVRMCKHYYVFNIEQTENVSAELPYQDMPVREFSPIEKAESILAGYPNPPQIEYAGDRAFYSRLTDIVTLPPKEHFDSEEGYYDTLFHELGHSTAHPDRLDRPFAKDKKGRAMEELIAELASAFLCAESGISNAVIQNEAAYIEGWLSYLKSDKAAFLVASGRAQKAADHILNKKAPAKQEEGDAA
jgi:antirestriction protein ArdC